MIKKILFSLLLCCYFTANSQVTVDEDDNLLNTTIDSTKLEQLKTGTKDRIKVDGIAAVVGDYLVLESDVDKFLMNQKERSSDPSSVTGCSVLRRIMENKLFAHQAVQDSIEVPVSRLQDNTEQQISKMLEQIKSMDKLLEFYNVKNEQELRDKLFDINKEQLLTSRMQSKVVDDIEVTPEEVRNFFESIPDEERPVFGDEVEVAQIVIKPKVGEAERQAVIDELNEYRDDILNGGSSFTSKAVIYSEDKGSRSKGGKIILSRDDAYVQEFKEKAFSLNEGEISKPFKTEFGWHILMVEKKIGRRRVVRHILRFPKITQQEIDKAREKIELIRKRIVDGEIEFQKAAREYSDEEETKGDGGQLINSSNQSKRFELSKMDPKLYTKIINLNEGEVSSVYEEEQQNGKKVFKILTVTEKYEEHKAEFSKDYPKIKILALKQKKLDELKKWQKEKAKETYVKISAGYKKCGFTNKWLN
jgi:peptidyl-prolyl cis-trans isomerase SurA